MAERNYFGGPNISEEKLQDKGKRPFSMALYFMIRLLFKLVPDNVNLKLKRVAQQLIIALELVAQQQQYPIVDKQGILVPVFFPPSVSYIQ